MTALKDTINDTLARVYCLGQDRVKGDDSPFKVDEEADKLEACIKAMLEDIIGIDEPTHGISGYIDAVAEGRNRRRREMLERTSKYLTPNTKKEESNE